VTTEARSAVLDRFRWVGGHADVWRVFADGAALAAVIESLADPWRGAGVMHVLGMSVVVDMLDAESRAELARVTAIVTADELGPSS
jgi:hypothetical protein